MSERAKVATIWVVYEREDRVPCFMASATTDAEAVALARRVLQLPEDCRLVAVDGWRAQLEDLQRCYLMLSCQLLIAQASMLQQAARGGPTIIRGKGM